MWILFGNRIEFGLSEFQELQQGIRDSGLYAYIERERPSLRNHLETILYQSLPDYEDWENPDLVEYSNVPIRTSPPVPII